MFIGLFRDNPPQFSGFAPFYEPSSKLQSQQLWLGSTLEIAFRYGILSLDKIEREAARLNRVKDHLLSWPELQWRDALNNEIACATKLHF